MSLDDHGALDGELELYGSYRYAPAPHAICHVCGHRVRLTDRRPRVMYRHRYGGQTGSDWCVGGRHKVGAIIPGFIGPYSRDPRPSIIDWKTTDALDPRAASRQIYEYARALGMGTDVIVKLDGREIARTTRAASKERDMSTINAIEAPYTQEQKQRAARILQNRNGWVPTHDEVIELLDEIAANNRKYVGVTFAPSDVTMRARPQVYTYQVAEGEPVRVGDYLQVYSPITDQAELVRVVRIGKGDWTGATKIAHRIDWSVVD